MLTASALAGVAPRIDRVLAVILPLFLLVDWLNGALLQYYGSSFGLAAVYKLALLALMALSGQSQTTMKDIALETTDALLPLLGEIDQIRDQNGLARAFARSGQLGGGAPFGFWIDADAKAPDCYAV